MKIKEFCEQKEKIDDDYLEKKINFEEFKRLRQELLDKVLRGELEDE